MTDPTPEQVEAAARTLDPDAFELSPGEWEREYGRAPEWSGQSQQLKREAAKHHARAALTAAAGVTPQESDEAQTERVAARLREVVYLCGDELGCQCEEAQAGADELTRELSIIAAGEPAFTADKVWALARALHDEAGDSDNVPAFASSLADSLRVAGIAFDEAPFVESGLLPTPSLAAPVQVDEAKLAEVIHKGICGDPVCDFGPAQEHHDSARAVAEWLRGGGQ